MEGEIMAKPCALVALSDTEVAEFFPENLWPEVERLLPGYRRVRPPLANPGEWAQIWRETPAVILVSGWQTPPRWTPASCRPVPGGYEMSAT